MKVLVTGGVRSGKSRHAEALCAGFPAVTYVAPGYPADPGRDPEWAARVAAHQARRPASWRTVETLDVAGVLADAVTPVLIDCLGTWVTRTMDVWDAWESPEAEVRPRFEAELADLARAVTACEQPVVIVTNEVGWGLVPLHASGRRFTDLLGTANQALGQACDEVRLVVAGRSLTL